MMNENIATTPFGGGSGGVRQFLRHKQLSDTRAKLSKAATGSGKTGADKWLLLRSLTEAKAAYELSDRSIAVLEALLSFHPERLLDGSKPLIVFPSNQQLALRTRGMSPATIRRHLAALVDAGLIFRRDSPNGKRYCRRDANGTAQDAFGFDLSPLALAAADIVAEAEKAHALERQRQGLRGEVTLHLRDIAKLLQAALNEQRAGDWEVFQAQLETLSGRVSRQASLTDLCHRRDRLVTLRAELEKTYLEAISEAELNACVRHYEHHIQRPESDQNHESAGEKGDSAVQTESCETLTEEEPVTAQTEKLSRETISLSRILGACPQIADYSRNGIGNWSDFLGAVALVRAILRISPAAWNSACAAMGEPQAALAVAAILERAEQIRSPGGYLKALAHKAVTGKFAVIPMMRALEQSDNRHACKPGRLV